MAQSASQNFVGVAYGVQEPVESTSLLAVRKVAAQVPSVTEFYLNDVSKVVSFRNAEHNCRINVYYTTGTVATSLFHPVSGKTQLFRRKVSMEDLKEIFINPRTHTGKGYFTKDNMPDLFRPENVLSEEDALKEKLSTLEPQVQTIKARLAEIEHKKLQLAAAQQAKQEELRKQAEAKMKAKVKAAVEAEAARLVQEQKEQLAKQKADNAAKLRKINLRGNNYHYCIDDENLPYSAADVACVALADGGCVYVTDDGTCYSTGLSDDVEHILSNQKYENVAYIALGERGQYYIRKKNGRALYCGCEDFCEDIRRAVSHPEFVAFGAWDTYFIQFTNGTKSYSLDLEDLLPSDVFDNLTEDYVGIQHVALSPVVSYRGTIGYCVVYTNGDVEYEGLDPGARSWLDHRHRSTKVKQVLLGENENYLIRYS